MTHFVRIPFMMVGKYEVLAVTGLPTVRRITKEESIVWQNWQNQGNDVQVINPVKKNNIREKREEAKKLQLNLFD